MAGEVVRSVHLFAGAGGDVEGFRQAGVVPVTASNHWPVAVATHTANHPGVLHRTENLLDVDWSTFPPAEILWASPSCVWHARSGGRARPTAAAEFARADPGAVDRATAFAVVAAAEARCYPVIVVENVIEFTRWALFGWWLDGLAALGYTSSEIVLDAADFGLAQSRQRWFGVFTQPGIALDLTVPDRPAVPASAILDPDPGRLVTRPLYVSAQIEQITEPGVPHLVTYRRHARARRADRHPLATVTAGGNHHGIARIDDDGRAWHRMVRNRECARAQGFPDRYQFTGNRAEVKRQIGNAVPVPIARWFAEQSRLALTGLVA